MRIFIKVTSYFKWLGLLGLPISISDLRIWRIFWLFGIVEILFSLPIYIQSLGQIISMLIIPLTKKPIPDIDNYQNEVRYSLPFTGSWVVVNGGVDKELSHS